MIFDRKKKRGTKALRVPHSICWIMWKNVEREGGGKRELSLQREAGVNLRFFNQPWRG